MPKTLQKNGCKKVELPMEEEVLHKSSGKPRRITQKLGRPTILTPEIQKKIVQMITAGNYMETAAAYAGITKPTLYDWMKRGTKEPTGIYKEFSSAIQKALAEAEIRDVITIGDAAKTNWTAAAWRLERKFPGRWGRQDRMERSKDDDSDSDNFIEALKGVADEVWDDDE